MLVGLVNALGTMLAESDDIALEDVLPLWQRMLAGLADPVDDQVRRAR